MSTSKKMKTDTDSTFVASNKADYDAIIDSISAIPVDELDNASIPPSDLINEAETLYYWALNDLDALVKAGMPADAISGLQPAAGALRFAESLLKNMQAGKNAWQEESPEGFELRDQLLHAFLFAYRDNDALLQQIHAMTQGSTKSDLVQHLQNLSVFGQENRQQLEQIGFDTNLLDKAAALSAHLGNILGESNAVKNSQSDTRLIRDQAFTYLKRQMGMVREYGKYLFYRDENHLRGYASAYNRKHRQKQTKEKAVTTAAEAVEVAVAA